RLYHVAIAVVRKARPQAVARLRRASVADPVRQDDEVLRRIQQLAGPEKCAGKGLSEELPTGAGSPVQDEHGWRALGPEGPVVQPQLREGLARGEAELPQDEVALGDR